MMRHVGVVLIAVGVLSGVAVGAQEKPGTRSSCDIVREAWDALNAKDYTRAIRLANECSRDYAAVAADQQSSIRGLPPPAKINDYWALNDVGAALYIAAQAFEKVGQPSSARTLYGDIARKYPSAQCVGAGDSLWSVAEAARDRIVCMDLRIDFGDQKSGTLTSRAWGALNQGRVQAAEAFADKCVALYRDEAAKMQASLRDFPSAGQEWNYWALNDVGTCLFIKGQALLKQGKTKEAEKVFQEILGSYAFAQCWDNGGEWFWKVADAARKLLYKNREI